MSEPNIQYVDGPDGEEIAFPANMPDEEIRAHIYDFYGLEPPQQETPTSDFLAGLENVPPARLMQIAKQGLETTAKGASEMPISDTLLQGIEDFSTSPTDDPNLSNPVTTAANIARPILEVGELVTDLGIDAWKATWGQHPLVNNEVVRQGVAGVKDSSVANWAMTALGEGYDAWMAFAEKNPVTAQMLKDTGVVAEVFTPKVGTPVPEKKVRKLLRTGTEQELARRKAGVQKLIEPENRVGEGETIEADGILRRKEYVPSDREDSIIEAMSIEPGVNPDRSFTYNHMKVGQSARQLNKDTKKAILKAGNPSIDRKQLLSDIEQTIEEMDLIPGYHSLSGDARKYAEDYYKEIQSILSRKKGSRATQILDARREFDKYVEQGAKVFDPHRESAKQVAARHIRDMLNQSVKDSVPGDEIHDLLNRQHQLLSGKDILRSKVAKEANNVFLQIGHKLREVGHLPATPLALYATVSVAASTAGAPVVGAGVAAGATAYHAWKGMTRGRRKQEVARLLKAMNESKGDFAAERVYLIELLKAEEAEEEGE